MAAPGREIEDDHGDFRAAHDGQHGGRQGVGGDVEKEQVHIGASKCVAGGRGLPGTVDHAQVNDLDAGAAEALRDLRGVIVELLAEAFELIPIGFEADGEETNAQVGARLCGLPGERRLATEGRQGHYRCPL